VDQALSALSISDQFFMKYVHDRVLPFLMATKLDSNNEIRVAALKKYIDLAVRCSDNGEFVCWIFERCQSPTELTEVAQSCGTGLAPHLTKFFQILKAKQSNENMEKDELIEDLISKNEEMERKINELIARLQESESLVVVPSIATFPATGGSSSHTIINSGNRKIMYKLGNFSGVIDAG
ncbi:hypothetical protein PMAYCL1PPCAC_08818, partial [Pristionchus mayeri]